MAVDRQKSKHGRKRASHQARVCALIDCEPSDTAGHVGTRGGSAGDSTKRQSCRADKAEVVSIRKILRCAWRKVSCEGLALTEGSGCPRT